MLWCLKKYSYIVAKWGSWAKNMQYFHLSCNFSRVVFVVVIICCKHFCILSVFSAFFFNPLVSLVFLIFSSSSQPFLYLIFFSSLLAIPHFYRGSSFDIGKDIKGKELKEKSSDKLGFVIEAMILSWSPVCKSIRNLMDF